MTSIDRRRALRTGAGAAVVGALAAGCAGTGPAPASPPPADAPSTAVPGRPFASQGSRPRVAPAARRFAKQPTEITHGPRDRDQVALTFHGNGDPATARAVLAEVERARARITVLAVGSWLDEYPELARRILDGGHDLGNHTQRHLSITEMPESEAYAEITACARRLRTLTGSIGSWFRPSRTQHTTPLITRLAGRAGYPHVLSYDLDSLDATSPGAAAVTRTVAGQIQRGSVVSLHFGYADTVAALPALLDDLDRRGLRAVTTTELLS
ncbi:polysaccharide deacetylase family protein [Streptomyces albipurpureus]|uniref:Polysaccharide deacetylase family protein n=1 Tax=Streptomyces albipurpureus TaxID=2897419 RepID=A0ABT0UGP6_9ACTN|nr:polysaccharide deacetylase family protein [Streptomyces sp. CWNU-1]MCM2387793.1 polysaccharide deacetylase family protein [Streptomyces sp. CWNU-1]